MDIDILQRESYIDCTLMHPAGAFDIGRGEDGILFLRKSLTIRNEASSTDRKSAQEGTRESMEDYSKRPATHQYQFHFFGAILKARQCQ